MRIIIAPQSLKGSLTAAEAGHASAAGARAVFPEAALDIVPVADGGEGTVRALVSATHGGLRRSRVHDPLGREIDAEWGVLGDGARDGGRVIGEVWATRKAPGLDGRRLVLVAVEGADRALVAYDTLDARSGQAVLV